MPHLARSLASSAASLAALAALLAPRLAGADLFSPGPLARDHAHLEGLSNCTKCHEAGQQFSQALCLECHAEIGKRVGAGAGYHGRIPEAERACQKCHRDHQGRGFQMIEWGTGGKAGFPHAKAGWPLRAAHAKPECAACHDRRLLADAAIRALLQKHPRKETYLGLSTRCATCHFDEHRGQVGVDCAKCHGEDRWKPAAGFDHGKTEYALRGLHAKVPCAKCHPAQEDPSTPAGAYLPARATSFVKYDGVPHGNCQDCHPDPHQGRFGPRCESCHSEASWSALKGSAKDQGFHERTRFPLRGGHVGVPCRSCHGPSPGQAARFRGLPFATCGACHADAHLGQLASVPGAGGKPGPPDCDRCHGVDGFEPARFELEDHAATSYPLDGAHQVATCRGCHAEDRRLGTRIPDKVRRELKRKRRPEVFSLVAFDLPGKTADCAGCHEDVHAGQFAARVEKQGCAGCHRTRSFSDLAFDHARDTRFALTGKHAPAACGSCHVAEAARGARAVVRWAQVPTACGACHADVHVGQLAAGDGTTDCARCHGTGEFRRSSFVHEPPFTTYLLEGKHAQVPCASCHPEVDAGAGGKARRYLPLPRACEGCHADFHRGAFRGFTP